MFKVKTCLNSLNFPNFNPNFAFWMAEGAYDNICLLGDVSSSLSSPVAESVETLQYLNDDGDTNLGVIVTLCRKK